jgi:hypothetical protein
MPFRQCGGRIDTHLSTSIAFTLRMKRTKTHGKNLDINGSFIPFKQSANIQLKKLLQQAESDINYATLLRPSYVLSYQR